MCFISSAGCVCGQLIISSGDKLYMWNQIFSISSSLRYRLFPFPTAKKNSEKQNNWKKLLNGQALHRGGLWEPSKDSHVFSRHFVDGEPRLVNQNPTLNMGYNTTSRALLCSPPTEKTKCTEEKGWIDLTRGEKLQN